MEVGYEGVDWIHVAQGKDHWPVVVIMIMTLRVL
jgi:hypothetical protein